LDDGGESLDSGGTLSGRGGEHHQRLGGEHQLPEDVKALEERQEGGEEVGGRRHEAAQAPAHCHRLVGAVGVAGGVGGDVELHHCAQDRQAQVFPCIQEEISFRVD